MPVTGEIQPKRVWLNDSYREKKLNRHSLRSDSDSLTDVESVLGFTYKRWSNPLACREKRQSELTLFTCGFIWFSTNQDCELCGFFLMFNVHFRAPGSFWIESSWPLFVFWFGHLSSLVLRLNLSKTNLALHLFAKSLPSHLYIVIFVRNTWTVCLNYLLFTLYDQVFICCCHLSCAITFMIHRLQN